MFPTDPPEKVQKSDDPSGVEEPSLDHFFQLILLDERSQEAWKESSASIEQQKKLARERKKLLQQKTSSKKSKK